MRIVFPDAGSNTKNTLTKDLINKIEQVGNFIVYEGVPKSKEEFLRRIKDADGLILGQNLPNEVMTECDRLKFISFVGYGVKSYLDIDFATKQGITIANTPHYGDNAVAEHALGLLMTLSKNIVESHTKMRNGIWDKSKSSIELKGKTIGLVGMGGIGERMSELCMAMGMNVISWTFNPNEKRSEQLGVSFVSLKELFSSSDFISLHLPYTNQTKNIIGENELALLQNGTILINTARSQLINQSSLKTALVDGRLAGAGLDVFDEEPIPQNDTILNIDNVILTPHISYNTPESVANMMKISVNNLVKYFAGTPINVVNK